MNRTKLREGLQPLLDASRNNRDCDELMEKMADKFSHVHNCILDFDKGIAEIIEARAKLPECLAEVRVISEILIFNFGMHFEDFEKALEKKTEDYIEFFTETGEEDETSTDLEDMYENMEF